MLITLGAIGLGFGLIAAYAYLVYPTQIESVEEGDCLSFDERAESFKPADCASESATLRVYRVFAFNDAAKQCVDVPGVTRTYQSNTETLCIGDKDADLSASINGITVGECVQLTSSSADSEAVKKPCGKNTYPVLLVLKDQEKLFGTAKLAESCTAAGAAGTTLAYAWGIQVDETPGTGSWDRVLCLGAKR